MKRYELSDGKSHKFWSVLREGSEVTTSWGRIGTAGQQKTKSFSDVASAQKEVLKVTRSKVKKGYVLVSGEDEAPPPSAQQSAPTPVKEVSPQTPPCAAAAPESAPAPEKAPETVVSLSPDALPDESVPYLGALNITAPTAKPLTVKAAWKRLLGKKPRGIASVEAKDKAWFGTGSLLLAAMAGEPASLGADPLDAGKRCAALCYQYSRRTDPAFLVDILVAEHGVVHAAVATVWRLAFEAPQKALMPGEGLAVRRYGAFEIPAMLVRMQAYLANADEATREEALAACGAMSSLSWSSKTGRAWLFPQHRPFFDEAKASLDGRSSQRLAYALLWEAAPGIPELLAVGTSVSWNPADLVGTSYGPPTVRLASVIERFGAAIAPVLTELVAPHADDDFLDKTGMRTMAALFAATPSDDAYRWLAARFDREPVQGAIAEASRAFPLRTLRTLAPMVAKRSAFKAAASAILRSVLRRHPSALDALRAQSLLSEGEERALQSMLEETKDSAPAALADCPTTLTEPRWLSRKATPKLPKLALTPLQTEPSIVWPENLRESWLEQRGEVYAWMEPKDGDFASVLERYGARTHLLATAPEAVARPHLHDWNPAKEFNVKDWATSIVARYELDVLPNVLAYVQDCPAEAIPFILPFRTPELAPAAAMALHKLKSVRNDARAWLRLHPEAAFEGLLPLVFGAKKNEQSIALGAIALLVGEGHGPTLERVANRYGEAAATAVKPLLDLDLLDQLPKKMPKLPEWTENVVSPELHSGGSLPAQALSNLLTMLAISSASQVYAGVHLAAEALTPKSLARFSWSLFEAWRMAGMDSKQNWAFTQLGLFGDDACARELTPILRKWPGEGGHARATTGLDILASIGSDVALMNLYGISQKLKYKGLKNKANEKVQEIARERGLSELELADRLVPDFDLGAQGTLELDFGPRKFTVTFDEHLKPVLRDESGKVRKSLPKVAAKDDAQKGAEATSLFRALKKDVRNVSGMQIARMEQAMCDGRSWSAEDFQAFFIDHPLMIHLVRRLVWQSGEGAEAQTFRVAEDHSIANVEDDEALLGPGPIRICHRLDLSDELAAQWGEVFADYELLQPFDQLGREVYELTEDEIANKEIKRVDKLVVPTRKVLSLHKFGWSKGAPQDAGVIGWMEREVPGVGVFIMNLDPGIIVGMMDEWPEQTLGSVQLHKSSWSYGKGEALNSLPASMVSEVLRALESLKTS